MSKENTNVDLILNNTHEHYDNLIFQKYKYETIDAINKPSDNNEDDNVDEVVANPLIDSKQSLLENEKNNNSIIPMKLKIIYSLPAFSKMACLVLLNIHALLFYESLGASLMYLSFFVSLARAIEILLKPVIAHLSDKAQFKLGRRRPFMLLGMFFYAIFLIVLFYPPYRKHYSLKTSIWFGVFYVLFFVADTVCNVPYLALGPELSSDTSEREKLYIIFYIFQYLGVLFASAAPVVIARVIRRCDCSFCENTLEITYRPDCINKCKLYCNLKSNESSLMYICMFIGGFFIISIIILSLNIKENKKSFKQKEETHFVPAITRLLDNKPFLFLIAPWILDVTISTIFATMLPFYLNFIVNPQKYCIDNNIDLNSDYCSTSTWLGYAISIFFVFCIVSMGLWHFIVKIIGKKRAWELYSLISVLTFSLFLMGDETSFSLMLFISIINAIPAGGAYLNDVFLADIIDYDEFITGHRNEGIYTVFSSFIPKIVSIFASSIPLSIMAVLGFVPSEAGANKEQPVIVLGFIRFYFIGVPIILAFISFCFKIKYPIDTEDQMRLIREAVYIQKKRIKYITERFDYYRIMDPIFQKFYTQIICKTDEQKETLIVAEHYRDQYYLNLLHKKDYAGCKRSVVRSITWIIIGLISSLTILITTFSFLEYKSLSFIPLCSLFVLAILIIFFILQVFRFFVINKVINSEYKIDHDFLILIMKISRLNNGEDEQKEK